MRHYLRFSADTEHMISGKSVRTTSRLPIESETMRNIESSTLREIDWPTISPAYVATTARGVTAERGAGDFLSGVTEQRDVPHRFINPSDRYNLRKFWTYASFDVTRTLVETGETGPIPTDHR